MKLNLLCKNLIEATNNGFLTYEEAFEQLSKFVEEDGCNIPEIPKTESDRKELETFIDLAKLISAKYSTGDK